VNVLGVRVIQIDMDTEVSEELGQVIVDKETARASYVSYSLLCYYALSIFCCVAVSFLFHVSAFLLFFRCLLQQFSSSH